MDYDTPQQANSSDCGVFTLKYAEYICSGKQLSFSQRHMNYFRATIASALVNKKLVV